MPTLPASVPSSVRRHRHAVGLRDLIFDPSGAPRNAGWKGEGTLWMHIRPPSKSDESAIRTVHETAFRHEGGREIADLAVEPLHDPTAMPVAPLIALVVPGSKEGANARGIGTVRCACAPNRPQHWRE